MGRGRTIVSTFADADAAKDGPFGQALRTWTGRFEMRICSRLKTRKYTRTLVTIELTSDAPAIHAQAPASLGLHRYYSLPPSCAYLSRTLR